MKRMMRIILIGVVSLPGLWTGAVDPFWAQTTFVKGAVTYLSPRAARAVPLQLGIVLHREDVVTTGEGARASFLLSDGGVLVVSSATSVTIEPRGATQGLAMKGLAQNLSQSLLAREGDNPMLKHLGGLRGAGANAALAPCRTKVRPGDLRFLWTPGHGTLSYIVTIMGPGDQIFEITTKEPSALAPAAKLAPGATYYWEVRDAATHDALAVMGSGTFTVLDSKTDAELRALERQIALALSSGDETDSTPLFLRYQLYRGCGLHLDALLLVDRMLQADPRNSDLLGWRRDLCAEMGLQERDVPVLVAGVASK